MCLAQGQAFCHLQMQLHSPAAVFFEHADVVRARTVAFGPPARHRRQIVGGNRAGLHVHHNVGMGKLRLYGGLGPISDLVASLQRLARIEDQGQVHEDAGPAAAHAHLPHFAHIGDLGRGRDALAQLRGHGIQQVGDRFASQLQTDPDHHHRHTQRSNRIGLGQPSYS